MRPLSTLTVVVLALLAAAPAEAQFGRAGQTRPVGRMDVRLGVLGTVLTGESKDVLDSGTGANGSLRLRVGRRERLSLRADVAWIPLADDVDPASGLTAKNALLLVGGGPEIALAVGWFEPYLHLFGGVFTNRMSLGRDDVATTDRRTSFGWGGGAGARVLLGRGSFPVSLDVTASLFDTGEIAFARAPESSAAPGGGLRDLVILDVSMLALSAGVSIGLF